MSKKRGLGKGLDSLIPVNEMSKFSSSFNEKGEFVVLLPPDLIDANPHQPRRTFDEKSIGELALSISKVGLLQPISVVEEGGRYTLVAGERRLRAAKMLGLSTIKAIIVNADERLIAELALIENLQREDLNPVDEANAYAALTKRHEMTHEMISELVGKSRAHISNYIRLLALNEEEQTYLRDGKISVGHAKVLLSVRDASLRKKILRDILQKSISVREAEDMASKKARKQSKKEASFGEDTDRLSVERRLEDRLGTKVQIKEKKGDSGAIVIDYYSKEDRERLLELLFHVEQ